MADDRVQVVFGADFSQLVAATQQVKEQLGSVADSARTAAESFASAGSQIGAGATASSEAVKDAFGLIDMTADTALQDVLFGAQGWREAMERLFSSLAQSFITAVASMILEWLEFEAVTATLGSGAAGVFGSSGLGGLLGGLFGIGSGAASSVGAVVPMFDVGTWSVPATGLAMMHQGEIVVPPALSDSIRGGGTSLGAGGPTMNLSIGVNALDARSVVQGVINNPTVMRSLAAALARYTPQNPSVD